MSREQARQMFRLVPDSPYQIMIADIPLPIRVHIAVLPSHTFAYLAPLIVDPVSPHSPTDTLETDLAAIPADVSEEAEPDPLSNLPGGPPDMPPPDPHLDPFYPFFGPPSIHSESPLTSLPDSNSSFSYDEYPSPTDYDAYSLDSVTDTLHMMSELPVFTSVSASHLALPFASSAGVAPEDIAIPHPCIFTDALHFMEMSVADAEAEYFAMLRSHICPEFIAARPDIIDLLSTLGLDVFVPQNWNGARIEPLSLRFAPDLPPRCMRASYP